MNTKIKGVFDYHEQTKHLPGRYAPSPGVMDWATEPYPYRLYNGAETTPLPLLQKDPSGGYEELFTKNKESLPFILENISAFFELSMGLSAVKSFMDSTWALRMNPSSGNLHPTESYIITPDNTPSRGVFHYNPRDHALEKRASFTDSFTEGLKKNLYKKGFITCLTSIDWREAWKYGSRAFRYSSIDTGHALACMCFSAALLGWSISPLQSLSDEDIRDMLGFTGSIWPRHEEERVEGAFFVHESPEPGKEFFLDDEIISGFKKMIFSGRPNRLSSGHVHWPIIEKVVGDTEKPRTEPCAPPAYPPHEFLDGHVRAISGAALIRRRRSAQAFDRDFRTGAENFFAIIDKTIPAPSKAPFETLHHGPRINLLIFVHRVEGLAKGLYMLMRNRAGMEDLKGEMSKDFLWKETEYKNLYLLVEGDLTEEARFIFCQQDIAGDGVFAASMIARFRENIIKSPYSYRGLFIEAGMIGQVLYLAAEAHGMRGTGIGCFYDDMVHELMGLAAGDNTFQSLYHFTVGAPIIDRRITTLSPYEERK